VGLKGTMSACLCLHVCCEISKNQHAVSQDEQEGCRKVASYYLEERDPSGQTLLVH